MPLRSQAAARPPEAERASRAGANRDHQFEADVATLRARVEALEAHASA